MTTLTLRSLNQIAFTNLRANRLRTMLSAAAVALGVGMIVATDIIGSAMRSAVVGQGEGQSLFGIITNLTDKMLAGIGLGILLVAAFLVFNAFTMSVTQRRQQIGALRALGVTQRQILRLTLIEAAFTGIMGTLVGLVLGPLLATGIMWMMSRFAGLIFAFGGASLSPGGIILGALLGVGITVVAVVFPARAAARVSPLAALRTEAAAGLEAEPVRRTQAGAGLIAVMAAYLVIAPPGRWVTTPTDMALTLLFGVLLLISLWLALPGAVGLLGRWARGPLTRRYGATGRLIADNLGRGRRRVTLTVLTLAAGLGMIVGFTGMMSFFFKELFLPTMAKPAAVNMQAFVPFDLRIGMAGLIGKRLEELSLPPDLLAASQRAFEGRARLVTVYIAFPPELAAMMPGLFSYLIDARELQLVGDNLFRFTQGDWTSALPIMESGCGLLISPAIASAHNVAPGGSMAITGPQGKVECKVAGVGEGIGGISIISAKAKELLKAQVALVQIAMPLPGLPQEQLLTEMQTLAGRYPGMYATSVETIMRLNSDAADNIMLAMNSILVLAILAAALGVVNTTMMSVNERQLELGLLRAVGATRRQVRAVVVGEAALIGLLGGLFGLLAGVGLTLVFGLVYGGNSLGLTELALWPAALRAASPALVTGLVGLVIAPVITAGAAWLPARLLLRGAAIEMLTAKR